MQIGRETDRVNHVSNSKLCCFVFQNSTRLIFKIIKVKPTKNLNRTPRLEPTLLHCTIVYSTGLLFFLFLTGEQTCKGSIGTDTYRWLFYISGCNTSDHASICLAKEKTSTACQEQSTFRSAHAALCRHWND